MIDFYTIKINSTRIQVRGFGCVKGGKKAAAILCMKGSIMFMKSLQKEINRLMHESAKFKEHEKKLIEKRFKELKE